MAGPRRWLAVLAVGAALVVVPAAAPAEAHNVLRSTDPADGSTVTQAPAEVVLTFDQPALALGTELIVTAPDGRNVSDGAARLVDNTVHQAVAGTLPAGAYTVQWRVTSADGHPVSGSFGFTATQATTRAALAPPQPTSTPAAAAPSGDGSRGPVAAVVVAVLVVAAGLAALLRRRRPGPR